VPEAGAASVICWALRQSACPNCSCLLVLAASLHSPVRRLDRHAPRPRCATGLHPNPCPAHGHPRGGSWRTLMTTVHVHRGFVRPHQLSLLAPSLPRSHLPLPLAASSHLTCSNTHPMKQSPGRLRHGSPEGPGTMTTRELQVQGSRARTRHRQLLEELLMHQQRVRVAVLPMATVTRLASAGIALEDLAASHGVPYDVLKALLQSQEADPPRLEQRAPSATHTPVYISAADFAAAYQVTTATVLEWRRRGDVIGLRRSGRWWICWQGQPGEHGVPSLSADVRKLRPDAELVLYYAAGASMRQIARELNLPRAEVHYALARCHLVVEGPASLRGRRRVAWPVVQQHVARLLLEMRTDATCALKRWEARLVKEYRLSRGTAALVTAEVVTQPCPTAHEHTL